MARPKQKWTSEEEEALKVGVGEYGSGKWKEILTDPRFASILANRSNVDLKDKWRNLNVSDYGSSSRVNASTSVGEVTNDQLITCPEPCTSSVDKRKAPPYKKMIYESLSSLEDPSGSDLSTMVQFLEPMYDLPKNFRRIFSAKLRRLVRNGDLEKVNHRYKVKGMSFGAETSQQEELTAPQNGNEEQVGPTSHYDEPVETIPTETLEDAASVAAFHVAFAETMEYGLAKNCKEKKKLAVLLNESMAMLTLAEDLYKQCEKDGSVNLLP